VDGERLKMKITTYSRPKATISNINLATASSISQRRCSVSTCWPPCSMRCWNGAMRDMLYCLKR
jgi:hypothetical protein